MKKPPCRSRVSRPRLSLALFTALLAATWCLPTAASALVLHFKGSATADAQTKVSFDVSGRYKQLKQGKTTKKVFSPSKVSNVEVEDQLFTCYDASGNAVQEGRIGESSSPVPYPFDMIEPITVAKSGKFSGVYEFVTAGHIVTRETFTGRIIGLQAKGAFQAQYDPGGIEYGYCGNSAGEPYSAKG